jgi:hypothetical protein
VSHACNVPNQQSGDVLVFCLLPPPPLWTGKDDATGQNEDDARTRGQDHDPQEPPEDRAEPGLGPGPT